MWNLKPKPMTIYALAACFGVSFHTFKAWIRNILIEDTAGDITFYQKIAIKDASGQDSHYRWQCIRRFATIKEIRTICNLLGDPQCTLKFNKTTLTSMAHERNIDPKELRKVILQYLNEEEIHFTDHGPRVRIPKPHDNPIIYSNKGRKIKCLTPMQVNKVVEVWGV